MSSEAAYFPDSLASTPEALRMGSSAPRTPTELLDEAETQSNEPVHPAADVIQISEISDEVLLDQICAGDKEALGVLFRRYGRSVRNIAYRILQSEAEAQDLVQEVFLRIFRKAKVTRSGCRVLSRSLCDLPEPSDYRTREKPMESSRKGPWARLKGPSPTLRCSPKPRSALLAPPLRRSCGAVPLVRPIPLASTLARHGASAAWCRIET
jgi:hypothetical protein